MPQRVLLSGFGYFCKLFKSFFIEVQIVISSGQPADRVIVPFLFRNGQQRVHDLLMLIFFMPLG
ncbi:hypothetical protein D3C72_1832520 [compost metagenome]